MTGGLLQLVAIGAQDVYLIGNPQITFFKVVYRRHTNFSIESIEQVLNGDTDFGGKVDCVISRTGDLIQNMYLQLELPTLQQVQNSSSYAGYISGVANAFIKSIEIEIGGQVIDKHYSEWLDIWSELNLNESRRTAYKTMVGLYNGSDYITNAVASGSSTEYNRYYMPLFFWFNRNPGLALPLISLQYHDVRLVASFRDASELVKSDKELTSVLDTEGVAAKTKNVKLWCDYIYLDTDERRKFAQGSHEYLIEQLQIVAGESIKTNVSGLMVNLNFNHPVKELHWVIVRDSNIEKNTSTGNNYFTYGSTNSKDSFDTAKILMNGHDRFVSRPADYFRLIQPFQHYNRTHKKYIYSYSFGLKPCDHQPSGSCNFSRIDNSQLNLTFTDGQVGTEGDRKVHIYAVNYNVLRIMSGMAGLAYSN